MRQGKGANTHGSRLRNRDLMGWKGTVLQRIRKSTLSAALVATLVLSSYKVVYSASSPRPLTTGTPVELIIDRGIGSQETRAGSIIQLKVAQDIKDTAGNVLIHRGAIATAEATWARPARFRDIISRRPPRLEIGYLKTTAVDGTPIALSFNPSLNSTRPIFKQQLRSSTRSEFLRSSEGVQKNSGDV